MMSPFGNTVGPQRYEHPTTELTSQPNSMLLQNLIA